MEDMLVMGVESMGCLVFTIEYILGDFTYLSNFSDLDALLCG